MAISKDMEITSFHCFNLCNVYLCLPGYTIARQFRTLELDCCTKKKRCDGLYEKCNNKDDSCESVGNLVIETLYEENHTRRLVEEKLLLRERQYRAITGLLIQFVGATGDILETILHNAVQLLGAVYGYIGWFEDDGKKYRIRHGMGLDPAGFFLFLWNFYRIVYMITTC